MFIQDKILGMFDLTQRGLTVNLEFVIKIPLFEPLTTLTNIKLTLHKDIQSAIKILWFHLFLLCSILVDWEELRHSLAFEFLVLILVLANDFFCYFCLSLCTKFRSLLEPTKSTKIIIQ